MKMKIFGYEVNITKSQKQPKQKPNQKPEAQVNGTKSFEEHSCAISSYAKAQINTNSKISSLERIKEFSKNEIDYLIEMFNFEGNATDCIKNSPINQMDIEAIKKQEDAKFEEFKALLNKDLDEEQRLIIEEMLMTELCAIADFDTERRYQNFKMTILEPKEDIYSSLTEKEKIVLNRIEKENDLFYNLF